MTEREGSKPLTDMREKESFDLPTPKIEKSANRYNRQSQPQNRYDRDRELQSPSNYDRERMF